MPGFSAIIKISAGNRKFFYKNNTDGKDRIIVLHERKADHEEEKNKRTGYPDENFIADNRDDRIAVRRYGIEFLPANKGRLDRDGC